MDRRYASVVALPCLLHRHQNDLSQVHHRATGLGKRADFEGLRSGLVKGHLANLALFEILEMAGVLHLEAQALPGAFDLHFAAAASFSATLPDMDRIGAGTLYFEVP